MLDRIGNFAGDGNGSVIVDFRQQNREFVAAQARHQIVGAQGVEQSAGDIAQRGIAGVVAFAIVDCLKLSRSRNITVNGCAWRFERSTSMLPTSKNARRFCRLVSASRVAFSCARSNCMRNWANCPGQYQGQQQRFHGHRQQAKMLDVEGVGAIELAEGNGNCAQHENGIVYVIYWFGWSC